MPSNAISGVGTKFKRWAAGSGFVDLAEVNSISGPNQSRETIDVTSLDSTGGYREFIGSFRDGGSVNLNMNFTKATYTLMHTDFVSDDLVAYKIVLPDTPTTSLEFTGLVMELPLEVSTGDKITANVTIKVSGQPIFRADDDDIDGLGSDSSS